MEQSTWTLVRSQAAVCLCCITNRSLHNITGSTGLRPLGFKHATTRGQRQKRERNKDEMWDGGVCVCVCVSLCCPVLLLIDSSFSFLRCFVNLVSGK